jgi:ribonuclease HI
MTYGFPPSLSALRDYLRSLGADTKEFTSARQAAFMAQQLLGTRVEFPPTGSDMTQTLLLIQKALPVKVNGAADKKISPAALARSAAKRSKPASHTQRPEKINHHPDISADVHIFCDGACEPNPGAGGWGVVVYRDGSEIDHTFGGGPQETNNTMELGALINAIAVAKTLDGPVTIWSDSQYAVKGTNEWMAGWKRNGWSRKGPNATKPETGAVKNLDLWKLIDEAMTAGAVHISIKWVKGHVGIPGNERADELSLIGRKEAMAAAGIIEPGVDYLDAEYRQIMGAM